MKSIWLMTVKDGDVVMNKRAKDGVTVGRVCKIAECEVNGGYADYARVTVNGEIYAEYEV